MSIEGGDICIRASRVPQYRLEDLLARVTRANLHLEVPSGPSVGREAW